MQRDKNILVEIASSARDLDGIIARSLGAARAQGRDYLSQSRAAAAAVLAVRPDLSFGQAFATVTKARDVAP